MGPSESPSFLSSIAGLFEGGVLNAAFRSNDAGKGSGGDGNPNNHDGLLVEKNQTLSQLWEAGSRADSDNPNKSADRKNTGASVESDIPELGRLERTEAVGDNVATRGDREGTSASAGRDVAKRVGETEVKRTAAASAPEPSDATTRPSDGPSSTECNAAGGVAGSTTRDGAVGKRARGGGGVLASNASTLVSGLSPGVTLGADSGMEANFDSPATFKSKLVTDTSQTRALDSDGQNNNTGDMNSITSNIPAPLDLSAIPGPAPPANRGSGGGGRGSFNSSGSYASSNQVVLQGAALENLKRLGRPRSSASDHSKGPRSARGTPVNDPGPTIPMAVPLGSAVPLLDSNQLLSRSQRKQKTSRESSRDFHTTGSVLEDAEREGGVATRRSAGCVPDGAPAWAKSESVSSSSTLRRGAAPMGIGGLAVGSDALRTLKKEECLSDSSSDDVPPPPSPMLTGHLRRPPSQDALTPPTKPLKAAGQQLPAGRGRAFKGRGVRPQTWSEDERLQVSPGAGGAAVQAGEQKRGISLAGGATQRQQQLRLVVRNPQQAIGASHNTFLNNQVSPGALSTVSCSTTFSRRSAGARSFTDENFNDSDKNLSSLARATAEIAKRCASPHAELVTGLGRGAFECISFSPGIVPRHGNDLTGLSDAVPSPTVRRVPSLKNRTVSSSNTNCSSSSSSRRKPVNDVRPRLSGGAYPSRSDIFDDSSSQSSASVYSEVRLDAPSLTVAHAPGKIHQPLVTAVSGSKQQRRSSGTAGRGTPATHSNGIHRHGTLVGGGGDASRPFRLSSSMRLTSFGSRASSTVSLHHDTSAFDVADKDQLAGAGKQLAAVMAVLDQSEDTSILARRPTTIDMLSTFGSRSVDRVLVDENTSFHISCSRSSGRSGPKVVDAGSGGVGGRVGEWGRGNREDTRRNSHREDRISQRRSRSSGSHGGGTRRFSSVNGSLLMESDGTRVRRTSRDRRSASRSISSVDSRIAHERGESSGAEGPRAKDSPYNVTTSAVTATMSTLVSDSLDGFDALAMRGLGVPADAGNEDQGNDELSVVSNSTCRGPARKEKISPRLSQSVRTSRSAKGLSPTLSSSSGRGGAASSVTAGKNGFGGKHRRRHSSGIYSGIVVARPRPNTHESGSDRGKSHRRSRSTGGRGGDASGHLRRGQGDFGTALEASKQTGVVGVGPGGFTSSNSGERPAKEEVARDGVARADVVKTAGPLVELVEQVGSSGGDVVPRTGPPPIASGDGTEGKRLWSRTPKKPLVVPSTPRLSGVRKSRVVKKRKARPFLAIAYLFRKNHGHVDGDGSIHDGERDDGTARIAVATAAGSNGRVRGVIRSESRELSNAASYKRGKGGGGGFACWLWRKITRQQPFRVRKGGGGADRLSPLLGGRARVPVHHNGDRRVGPAAATPMSSLQQQQRPISMGNFQPRMLVSRPRAKSHSHHHFGNNTHQEPRCEQTGAIIGGCITQFYNASVAEDAEAIETTVVEERGNRQASSGEGGARVQQLLRTSQVHVNKHHSLRLGSSNLMEVSGAAPSKGRSADKAAAASEQ